MSRFQAIALDMDGTLLTRDHKISSATRAALAEVPGVGHAPMFQTPEQIKLVTDFLLA